MLSGYAPHDRVDERVVALKHLPERPFIPRERFPHELAFPGILQTEYLHMYSTGECP